MSMSALSLASACDEARELGRIVLRALDREVALVLVHLLALQGREVGDEEFSRGLIQRDLRRREQVLLAEARQEHEDQADVALAAFLGEQRGVETCRAETW